MDENKHSLHIIFSNFPPNYKPARSKNITTTMTASYKHYYDTNSLRNRERMQTYH
jgi:hypothetical protein